MTVGRGRGKKPKATHQSCSATFNYLVKKGLIEKSGKVGVTRYGRKANLYRPVYRETLFEL